MNMQELCCETRKLDKLRTEAWLAGRFWIYKSLTFQYDLSVNMYFDLIQDKAQTDSDLETEEKEEKIQKGSLNIEKMCNFMV